jgi:enamine deaminase RidA (YjgF/YER057c/UK114 family)
VVVHGLLRPDARIEVEIVAGDPDRDRAGPDPARAQGRPAHGLGRTTAHGLTYLSSLVATDAHGAIVGGDDLVAQTAAIYEKAAAILAPLGLGTEHIVKTVEYVKPHTRRAYPATGRVRKEYLAAPYGGGTGIVMDALAHPDALIAIDMVASPLSREAVNPGWERYGKLTYNPGLRVGDLLVLSGQAALDVETERAVLPGDVVAQTRYTYDNILRVLEAAGVGPEALVQTIEYVTPDGLADYRRTADVRRQLFAPPYPAATGIVCSGLLRPEFLIEIDAWAILPPGTSGATGPADGAEEVP